MAPRTDPRRGPRSDPFPRPRGEKMSQSRHIVGIGGTTREGSSSEQALRMTLDGLAAEPGTTTRLFGGAELAQLPMYAPEASVRGRVARDLVEHLRAADGVVIASPGYHGSISGLVKNALDYTEDMRDDARPYLADRSVGLIVTAYGWQASVTTLSALRSIVHALRGWATPFGAAINSQECRFEDGVCTQERVTEQLARVADEVGRFADLMAASRQPGQDPVRHAAG